MIRCCCGRYELDDNDDSLIHNGRHHEALGVEGNSCAPLYKHEIRDMKKQIQSLQAQLEVYEEALKRIKRHSLTPQCIFFIADDALGGGK